MIWSISGSYQFVTKINCRCTSVFVFCFVLFFGCNCTVIVKSGSFNGCLSCIVHDWLSCIKVELSHDKQAAWQFWKTALFKIANFYRKNVKLRIWWCTSKDGFFVFVVVLKMLSRYYMDTYFTFYFIHYRAFLCWSKNSSWF